jgi:hypothetical protein
MPPNNSTFTGLKYDTGAYIQDVKESLGPFQYLMQTPNQHCTPCFPVDPTLRVGRSGVSLCPASKLVDLDSELHNRTRKLSHCPTEQFMPNGEDYCKLSNLSDCKTLQANTFEHSRLNNPACTLRGNGWNRWEWLCENPQNHAIREFQHSVNTGILFKDNHRPCIPSLNVEHNNVVGDLNECVEPPKIYKHDFIQL